MFDTIQDFKIAVKCFLKKGAYMGMTSSEFKEFIRDGYGMRYRDSDEGESELRCFTCGKKARLGRVRRKWRVKCIDGHNQKMKDFLLELIRMRDGITDMALLADCDIYTPVNNT